MKIESNFKPTALAGTPSAPSKSAASKSKDSAEVHLSEAGRLAASDDSGGVDMARIAEIKQAIAEGRFKVNTGAIADSLLATAREMIASGRSA